MSHCLLSQMGRHSKGKNKSESLPFCILITFGKKSLREMSFYNLAIAIEQQKCVVVGGGKVALRKVRKLCTAGASVTVIAPEILEEIQQEDVVILCSQYKKTVLIDAVLVFAATSDVSVNEQVAEDAKSLGIWVNSVNGAANSSFIIPASCTKGCINIGVTTEGKAPVLSKELRKYLQQKLHRVSESLIEEIVVLRNQMVFAENAEERKVIEDTITRKITKIIKQMGQ